MCVDNVISLKQTLIEFLTFNCVPLILTLWLLRPVKNFAHAREIEIEVTGNGGAVFSSRSFEVKGDDINDKPDQNLSLDWNTPRQLVAGNLRQITNWNRPVGGLPYTSRTPGTLGLNVFDNLVDVLEMESILQIFFHIEPKCFYFETLMLRLYCFITTQRKCRGCDMVFVKLQLI